MEDKFDDLVNKGKEVQLKDDKIFLPNGLIKNLSRAKQVIDSSFKFVAWKEDESVLLTFPGTYLTPPESIFTAEVKMLEPAVITLPKELQLLLKGKKVKAIITPNSIELRPV